MTATLVKSYAVRCQVDALPPTVNHMYKSIGNGRKALTQEVIDFRQLVALAVRQQPSPPSDARLVLNVWLTFGNRRVQDGDNRIKALQDAIALALHFNSRLSRNGTSMRRLVSRPGVRHCWRCWNELRIILRTLPGSDWRETPLYKNCSHVCPGEIEETR
jgi:hypothetical protein